MNRPLISAFVIFGFVALMWAVPPRLLTPFFLTVALALAIGILWSYLSYAVEALKTRTYTQAHALALGIMLAWLAFLGLEVLALTRQFVDIDEQLNWILTQTLFAINIVAAAQHRVARFIQPGISAYHRWRATAINVLVGIAGGLALVAVLYYKTDYFETPSEVLQTQGPLPGPSCEADPGGC